VIDVRIVLDEQNSAHRPPDPFANAPNISVLSPSSGGNGCNARPGWPPATA
jgi:hypothetical protein